ncbi:hypothetical protein Dsin_024503 [Dipteronia sinensis]|uniref:Reverse transcriptase domain-containing protein n=1 Tax=Dipteronia sinensis TaxID=43782 RepID=A0AAD9ZVH0_9ROSI|nr:hypothetical protein Dsin_024503 [Dipteronia sinensis]
MVLKTLGNRVMSHNMENLAAGIRSWSEQLDQWNFRNRCELRKSIRYKQIEMGRASLHLVPGSWIGICKVEKEMDLLLEQEEIYWRQRSRETWLQSGDRNSKYFHSRASMRKSRNVIHGLFDSENNWRTDKAEIFDVVERYFTDMFRSVSPSNSALDLALDCVSPCLSARNYAFLESYFSNEEIRKAVCEMTPTKAPGPDGIPALCYQKFWPIVGSQVISACLGVLNLGYNLDMVNNTLITLIPKVKRADKMADFRPISLCNMVCKIVTKAMANRFRGVLDEVISETQNAFIPSRLISDNSIVGFECMHALKRCKKGRKRALALKLDMSKVYDRVEWCFIEGMIRKIGFLNGWIDRVMNCVRTVSFSFIVNGEIWGNLRPSRGLLQGDPLSLYLFPIYAEGLSHLIHNAIMTGDIAGFKCSRGVLGSLIFSSLMIAFYLQGRLTEIARLSNMFWIFMLELRVKW